LVRLENWKIAYWEKQIHFVIVGQGVKTKTRGRRKLGDLMSTSIVLETQGTQGVGEDTRWIKKSIGRVNKCMHVWLPEEKVYQKITRGSPEWVKGDHGKVEPSEGGNERWRGKTIC